ELHQVMLVAPFFWAGSLFRFYREYIKFTMGRSIALCMLMALAPPGPALWAVAFFAIPYIALAFGAQDDPLFKLSPRIGDMSYGIYIYAFPLQQTTYYFLHSHLSFWPIQGISAAATILFAYVSWHWVESPALRMKPAPRKALVAVA